MRGHHKRKMVRKSPDDLPVKLPWGGKMGSCSFDHGHLPEHPLRMGVDHRQSDLAADLGRNTYVRQRNDIYNPLMLADSGPEEECYHSLNWVTVGKAKQKHNRGE